MTVKEQILQEIDSLPDDMVKNYILFQKYRLGIYEDDSAYLDSIPGMFVSIQKGPSANLFPRFFPMYKTVLTPQAVKDASRLEQAEIKSKAVEIIRIVMRVFRVLVMERYIQNTALK